MQGLCVVPEMNDYGGVNWKVIREFMRHSAGPSIWFSTFTLNVWPSLLRDNQPSASISMFLTLCQVIALIQHGPLFK